MALTADTEDAAAESSRRPFWGIALLGVVLAIGIALGWAWVSGALDAAVEVFLPMPPRSGPEARDSALLTPPGGPNVSLPTTPPAAAPPVAYPPRAPAPPPPQLAAATPAPGAPPPSYDALPLRAGQPLGPAPLVELLEPETRLPVVARDGTTARRAYARPFAPPAGKALVAVVVTDLGLDSAATTAAIERLPPDVTLAFSPHAPDLDAWVAKARAAGHEVALALPMEARGFPQRDPGAQAMLAALSAEALQVRLAALLAKMTSYVGVVGVPDSPAAAADAFASVLATLDRRGLLYAGPLPRRMPNDVHPTFIPIAAAIDEAPHRAAIDERLAWLARTAETEKRVAAVLRPSPLGFERLVAWLDGLGPGNVALAPLSTVVVSP